MHFFLGWLDNFVPLGVADGNVEILLFFRPEMRAFAEGSTENSSTLPLFSAVPAGTDGVWWHHQGCCPWLISEVAARRG